MNEEMTAPPVAGVDASRQIETMQRMHSQKIRTLMTSIHMLKEQLAVAKAASKEHRRSALIQQLRDAVRDQELVVDVLRQALVDRGLDDVSVNELIIKRTCGGPKRFRPKSREELQRDTVELSQKCQRLEAALAKSKANAVAAATSAAAAASAKTKEGKTSQARGHSNRSVVGGAGTVAVVEAAPLSSMGGSVVLSKQNNLLTTPRGDGMNGGAGWFGGDHGGGGGGGISDAVELGHEVSELQLEVEVAGLRAALGGNERVLAEQSREVEKLRHVEREFARLQDSASECKHKYRDLKSAYREQHGKLAGALDQGASMAAQLGTVNQEAQAFKEESELKVQALSEEFSSRMVDLRDALGREGLLAVELERETRSYAAERASLRHELREEANKREGLSKRLGEELAKTKRLEAKLEAKEAALEAQGGLPQQLEGVKDKLRASSVHTKSLSKELLSLRSTHEAEGKELAALKQRCSDGEARFTDLAEEASLTRQELAKCEFDLAESRKAQLEHKSASDADKASASLEFERLKLSMEGQQQQSQTVLERSEMLASNELGRIEHAVSALKTERDELVAEKASLSAATLDLSTEVAAQRAQRAESMSTAAAQHGQLAETMAKELEEVRGRLRGAERRVEVEAGRRKAAVDVERSKVEASAQALVEQAKAQCLKDVERVRCELTEAHTIALESERQQAKRDLESAGEASASAFKAASSVSHQEARETQAAKNAKWELEFAAKEAALRRELEQGHFSEVSRLEEVHAAVVQRLGGEVARWEKEVGRLEAQVAMLTAAAAAAATTTATTTTQESNNNEHSDGAADKEAKEEGETEEAGKGSTAAAAAAAAALVVGVVLPRGGEPQESPSADATAATTPANAAAAEEEEEAALEMSLALSELARELEEGGAAAAGAAGGGEGRRGGVEEEEEEEEEEEKERGGDESGPRIQGLKELSVLSSLGPSWDGVLDDDGAGDDGGGGAMADDQNNLANFSLSAIAVLDEVDEIDDDDDDENNGHGGDGHLGMLLKHQSAVGASAEVTASAATATPAGYSSKEARSLNEKEKGDEVVALSTRQPSKEEGKRDDDNGDTDSRDGEKKTLATAATEVTSPTPQSLSDEIHIGAKSETHHHNHHHHSDGGVGIDKEDDSSGLSSFDEAELLDGDDESDDGDSTGMSTGDLGAEKAEGCKAPAEARVVP